MVRILVTGHEAVARTARELFPLADKAGDEPAPGVAVQHREFFRHAHRVADGQDIAENGQAGRAGDLAEDGRVHEDDFVDASFLSRSGVHGCT